MSDRLLTVSLEHFPETKSDHVSNRLILATHTFSPFSLFSYRTCRCLRRNHDVFWYAGLLTRVLRFSFASITFFSMYKTCYDERRLFLLRSNLNLSTYFDARVSAEAKWPYSWATLYDGQQQVHVTLFYYIISFTDTTSKERMSSVWQWNKTLEQYRFF